ncbi:putative LRR receptor-like serine/threonine-protein kinase [Iris pallida]|uniref:endo-polygalacturonase n=1 Tax=Iris pallida TaxID=29817 RepID=A0AAX6G1C0_IRIPA|nr:putative LRR receptor-like serine/threonine-protein kinase [Iris pallida]
MVLLSGSSYIVKNGRRNGAAALFLLLLVLSSSSSSSSAADVPPAGNQSVLSTVYFSSTSPPKNMMMMPRTTTGRRKKRRLQQQMSITDHFGALGDGSTDDTQAFEQAWSRACSSQSGAVVHVPPGKVYLLRPITLAGPCKSTVKMLIAGTIIAPSDPDSWAGLDNRRWLYFHHVNKLILTGGGTIDGRGQRWWASSCKINATNPCRHAPTAVTFHRIKQLKLQDLTLRDSQQMHMAFNRCSRVAASRLKVTAPANSPNTDGIHISSSNNVIIEYSQISTGDDCISIVGNSSNVHITDIVCGPGHGISIGSLGKSNSLNQVRNIHIDGALISNTKNGVRIKTWQGGRGYANDITFHNIVMRNVSNPIIIDQYYCDSKIPCQNQTSAIKVDNISFIGIKGTSATKDAMKFACSDTCPCENIYLEDIQLFLDSGEDTTAYCWKASGLSSGLVHPPSCLSVTNGLVIEQNIVIDNAFHPMEK